MRGHLWRRGTAPTLSDLQSATAVDENGCWVWQRLLDPDGYARIGYQGRTVRVHRLSWSLANGEIPSGMVIDHLCFNRACINPDHLQVVTWRENGHRKLVHQRPTCPRGHEYTPENTYWYQGRRRNCRECWKEAWQRRSASYNAKRRAARLAAQAEAS